MTGYMVRKKNLFYYKCNTAGCRHNQSAKRLHDNWSSTLDQFPLDPKYLAPLTEQYRRILDELHQSSTSDITLLKTRRTEINQKLNKLEERFVLGQVAPDLYQKYRSKYEVELRPVEQELGQIQCSLSNHKELTESTVRTMCNLLTIWQKCDSVTASKFVQSIYPEGIVLDKENGNYRTSGLNPAIRVISELVQDSGETKKRNKMDLLTYSALVARPGIEPGSKV